MKFALLVGLGLVLGALGGGAVGIGAGIIWSELIQPQGTVQAGSSLVLFTFMPAGVIAGALCGAALFGVAQHRSDIRIEQQPVRGRDS